MGWMLQQPNQGGGGGNAIPGANAGMMLSSPFARGLWLSILAQMLGLPGPSHPANAANDVMGVAGVPGLPPGGNPGIGSATYGPPGAGPGTVTPAVAPASATPNTDVAQASQLLQQQLAQLQAQIAATQASSSGIINGPYGPYQAPIPNQEAGASR